MEKHVRFFFKWPWLLTMLTIILPEDSFGEIARIESDGICGEVNIDTDSENFGALLKFSNKKNININNVCLFPLQYGEIRGKKRSIIKYTPDELCLGISGFKTYPLMAEITFSMSGKALILNLKAWVTQPFTLTSELFFFMGAKYKNITVKGFGTGEEIVDISSFHLSRVNQRIINCINSHYKFQNTLTDVFSIVIRNPFHSFWEFNSYEIGQHKLIVIPTLFPNGPYSSRTQEGPLISSKMSPKDTIFRRIEIVPSLTPEIPMSFNEHKDGWSQCITMYWDELPNRDKWAFMTTSEARDVKYDHYFVRLLNEHPKLKMGYLLIADRILFRYHSYIKHWKTHCEYSIPDSLDAIYGNWCILFYATKKRSIKISQDISCKPKTEYTLKYDIKTENIIGTGAYGEVYGSTDAMINSDKHHIGTNNWQTRTISFTTGDNDTAVRVYLRIENSTGQAYFDDISLYETGNDANLVKNGGFEECEPRFIYDNKQRHWSDAHGPLHLPSVAPEKYINFLKRIENNELEFGWEDRVSLGCHGYHHTPSLHEPDNLKPGWEFQYYDPEGDKLRMNRIFTDIQAIGLTKESLRYFRSPGFKYSKSLVDLAIDSGFVFFDIGIRDFYYSIPFQRDGKRLWAVSTCWWADKNENHLLRTFEKSLALGHLAQIGGHPGDIFENGEESTYQRIHNVLSNFEKQYPNLGYVFPDEYSDNANAIYDLHVLNISRVNNNITLSFQGKVNKGNSIVFEGSCKRALFNGNDVQVKNNGSVMYIILPEALNQIHTLNLLNVKVLKHKKSSFLIFYPKKNTVSIYLKKPSTVECELYNMSGQKIIKTNPKQFYSSGIHKLFYGNTNSFAPGMYIFRLRVNGKCVDIRKVNILKY